MNFDLAVVGAGPAGLSAAVHSVENGLRVALVDAGPQPGGQFWRHSNESVIPSEGFVDGTVEGYGHHDWKRFENLRGRLYAAESSGSLRYLRNTQVWSIESGATSILLRLSPVSDLAPVQDSAPVQDLAASPDLAPTLEAPSESRREAAPRTVTAQEVILCPGGYDRQLPIPGWDLPGVMAAGGVQALLKGSGTAAGKVAVVAGTGPFLLPVAAGLAKAGVKVAAICEANSPTGWLKNLAGALRAPEKALEGAEYATVLAKHRIPYKVRTAVTHIHGAEKVEGVTLSKLDLSGAIVPGTARRLDCDVVALGWGFTPQLELVLGAGAQTDVDVDGSLVAVVDSSLRSSTPGISVAGESTGVGGAAMAVLEGELAALCIAAASDQVQGGAVSLAERIASLQRDRSRLRSFAVAMHRANPVPDRWTSWLTPDTVVCRCEEVSYSELCNAHTELGAQDARSLKSYARPGMGWCQGRVCGFATAEIVADFATRSRSGTDETSNETTAGTRRASAVDLRAMARRTLAVPVALGALAELDLIHTTADSRTTEAAPATENSSTEHSSIDKGLES